MYIQHIRLWKKMYSLTRKYTFKYQDPPDFADVTILLAKNQRFLAKIVPLLKAIVWELCEKFFSSVFSFCKVKGYY